MPTNQDKVDGTTKAYLRHEYIKQMAGTRKAAEERKFLTDSESGPERTWPTW